MIPYGYTGRILGSDLSDQTFLDEDLDNDPIEKYIRGAGFGTYYLYRENPNNVEWRDPQDRIIFANDYMDRKARI